MLRPGQIVMLCALAMLTVGVVMVNSASMAVQPVPAPTVSDESAPTAAGEDAAARPQGVTFTSLVTSRSSGYFVAAVAVMLIASVLPVRRWAEAVRRRRDDAPNLDPHWRRTAVFAVGCGLIIAVLALVYTPGFGVEINGSNRWVDLGAIGLGTAQPSEVAKWLVPVLLAWYLTGTWGVREGELTPRPRLLRDAMPALIGLGLVSAVIVVEDLGTGVLVATAGGLVLLAAGMRLWHAVLFVPPAIGAVGYAILSNEYRIRRVETFIDPFADPRGDSYHVIQSLATVSGGGPFGRGLGHGLQKFGYLPQDTTDFLFAVVCEELGLAGATAVLSLLGLLVYMVVRIALRETNRWLSLYCFGVAATIGVQSLINVFVVLGLAPAKGIALPLISAGGTGWILTAGSLGLVASIARSQAAEPTVADADADASDDLADDAPRPALA